MANTITTRTVCRGLTALTKEKTYASFVGVGGDYRTEQNKSKIQKFINWLAQFFDKGYAIRTQLEIGSKQEKLGDGFLGMAEEILKARSNPDGTVSIQFKFDDEPLRIVSYPTDPNRLFVQHLWNDRELEGIDLSTLKTILLDQYSGPTI